MIETNSRTDATRNHDFAAAAYYDEMQRFYGLFWHSTGVHYGLWRGAVSTHDEAVAAMDQLVADSLCLPNESRILDAGCGIGGTSFYLASKSDHRIVGLTLSADQLRRAHARAREARVKHRPVFLKRSYMQTELATGSFDGVFGVESICYAQPKRAFLQEAQRLLRPGGRLVVLDGFASADPTARARSNLQKFCDGFAIESLAVLEEFVEELGKLGFVDIEVENLTTFVDRSATRILHLSQIGSVLAGFAERVGPAPEIWLRHCRAGLVQRDLLRAGDMRYCSVVATRG